MFTVKIIWQNANGETVETTREGVVDLLTFPRLGKAKFVFNDNRDDEELPMNAEATVNATPLLK
jgi:hypothetical protein